MGKTVFVDGDPSLGITGTIVNAAFLNALNKHRHDGLDQDGHGVLDYAVAAGAAGAYEIELNPALTALIPGMLIIFKSNHESAGAATLKIDALEAIAIKDAGGNDLWAGYIKSGQVVIVVYDGAYFQILSMPASTGIPVGAEILWLLETPPDGWLEEDGASLSRASYPELYAKIGTLYGAADANHFNLPDSRGRFPRIWAHGSANDPDRATRTIPGATGATMTAGDHVGTLQADQFKSHTHTVTTWTAPNSAGTLCMGGGGTPYAGQEPIASAGGNETRSINTARMMVIKY